MEDDKLNRLLLRQLRDIQTQAEKITADENSREPIEALRDISQNSNHASLTKLITEIRHYAIHGLPEINYKRTEVKTVAIRGLPSWGRALNCCFVNSIWK